MKALISDVKRFAIHDGDGIRTTVFFKGCPLKCIWCHNPESISFRPQIAFYKNKCIGCEECITACKRDAQIITDNVRMFDRKKCNVCGKCTKVCLGEALVKYGKEVTEAELLWQLMEDRDFYEASNGGVTLSGGECLSQADFCAELLKLLKKEGINTAVDTCGYVPRENIRKVIPYTDTFLYDIKAIDEDVHIKCTGHSNKQILENLRYIDSMNKAIEIRIPLVMGYNDNQIKRISVFLKEIRNIKKIKILPYHDYAGSKYEALDMENTMPKAVPSKEQINKAELDLAE